MKANEAPEKIHVQPNAHNRWFEGKIPSGLPNGLFVEYTRTDGFIEKAAEWQRKELCNYFDAPIEDFERFIEDFKNYMKGK